MLDPVNVEVKITLAIGVTKLYCPVPFAFCSSFLAIPILDQVFSIS
jgi:hypothetical protein